MRRLVLLRPLLALWLAGLVMLAAVQTSSADPDPQGEAFRAPIVAVVASQPKIVAVKPVTAETSRGILAADLPGGTTQPMPPVGSEAVTQAGFAAEIPLDRVLRPCARSPPALPPATQT